MSPKPSIASPVRRPFISAAEARSAPWSPGALLRGESGAVLLWIIASIVLISGLGITMVQVTTTATFAQLASYSATRAYYMAESGYRYALPIIRNDPTNSSGTATLLDNKTFTLANGDKFELKVSYNTANSTYSIQSTGVVKDGNSWFTARQVNRYNICFPGQFDEPFNTTNNWKTVANDGTTLKVKIQDNALNTKIRKGVVSVKWSAITSVDPLNARTSNDGLLSYDVQVKTRVASEGGKGKEYMVGISFRLNESTDDSYGISFMRAESDRDDVPSAFDFLKNGNLYLVLWKKVSGVYTILDWHRAQDSDGVRLSGEKLKDWSTLVVHVEEQYKTDGSGNVILDGLGQRVRTNLITGYIQGSSVVPRGTINWTLGNFVPVNWKGHTQPVMDDSLTSKDFNLNNGEIGLHWFYDSNASNDIYFDDFSLKLGGGGSGQPSQTQY